MDYTYCEMYFSVIDFAYIHRQLKKTYRMNILSAASNFRHSIEGHDIHQLASTKIFLFYFDSLSISVETVALAVRATYPVLW